MSDQNHPIQGDQLQAYLDDALDAAARAEIQDHLEICPDCREQLARLETLSSHLENLPELDLSKDLSGLVISRLEEENSLSPAITWTLVIEAIAAGGVIAALIPAFQAAGWLPQFREFRLTLSAAINVFLTQLASSWLVWWAGLKLQLNQLIGTAPALKGLAPGNLSPWILIGSASILAVIINGLLLGRGTLPGSNQNQMQP